MKKKPNMPEAICREEKEGKNSHWIYKRCRDTTPVFTENPPFCYKIPSVRSLSDDLKKKEF